MVKYIYLIYLQIREHALKKFLVVIELTIAYIALFYIFGSFMEYVTLSKGYHQYECKSYLAAQVKEKASLSQFAEMDGVQWADWQYNYFMGTSVGSQKSLGMVPLTYNEVKEFDLSFEGKGFDCDSPIQKGSYQALVNVKEKSSWPIGSETKLKTVDGECITVKVVGYVTDTYELDKYSMEDKDSVAISKSGDDEKAYIFGDETAYEKKQHKENRYVTMRCKPEKIEEIQKAMLKTGIVVTSVTGEEAWDGQVREFKQSLIIPGILGASLLLLTILHIITDNLLSIADKEYLFGIFSLYGGSQKKCIIMQCIQECICFFLAFIISVCVVARMHFFNGSYLMLILVFLMTLFISGLAIGISVHKLYRKDVLSIIERRE